MTHVSLAHIWSHCLPKSFNPHPELLCVLGFGGGSEIVLHCPPNTQSGLNLGSRLEFSTSLCSFLESNLGTTCWYGLSRYLVGNDGGLGNALR